MLIGYARVSTEDQNLDLQLDALRAAGCTQVCTDKVTGTAKKKDGLDEALKYARPGDTLVVWKLDRLGRTVKGLVELVEALQARDVQFKSITDAIDTSTPAGRFFFMSWRLWQRWSKSSSKSEPRRAERSPGSRKARRSQIKNG